MGLFDRFKHSRRIAKLEQAVSELQSAHDTLAEDVLRVMEARKKDRARAMAAVRWDRPEGPRNGPPSASAIGSDPISLQIKSKREQRRHSLAELVGTPFSGRDPEEE